MESSSAAVAFHGSSEQSQSSEEPHDQTSQGMERLAASSAAGQVGAGSSHAPPAPATTPTQTSRTPSPEADPPPSYDSLLVTTQQPAQPRALSGLPPSYSSAYRMDRKTSCPAGYPGVEGEAAPARRMRKKPCVTLNIDEATGASPDTWCSLASGLGASPAPSIHQEEGEVHDFRSNSGKNVFFYVQDETDEVSAAKGCDNLGFVIDEKDGSQIEGFVLPLDTNPTLQITGPPGPAPTQAPTPPPPTKTVVSVRRSSNPEYLAVPREEMVRSQSFGTDLGESAAPPTLRKRSTSRSRLDPGSFDSQAESKIRETSLTPTVGERAPRHVTQTGSDEAGSPSLLRKIFSSPFLGLSRSPSTKSCRSMREENGRHPRSGGGQHFRPPQGPPSVREDQLRHHHYMLQHHLYRNSRRNVQEKLHRQLSESDNHHHHHHGRHHPAHHDPSDNLQHHGHGRAYHHHHHRSQSQRNPSRPRHESLRRLNTYGNDHFLKFSQDLEERCHQDSPEASAGREEEEEEGEEEETAVRRVSHYRQEEKGLTDVER